MFIFFNICVCERKREKERESLISEVLVQVRHELVIVGGCFLGGRVG